MKPIPFLHPVPIVLVGVLKPDRKANFSTIGDVAVAGLKPPLLMISLNERHLTRELLDENKVCAIHVPKASDMEKVDFCGLYSGRIKDKDCLFDYSIHKENVPVISAMPFVMVARVRERIKVETRIIYILDVLETIISDEVKTHGIENIRNLMYGLDNYYYSSGERIGVGYQEGTKINSEKE